MTPAQDGLLLLDKPEGVSSFQALYPVKRVFRGKKIGHAGTLDPAASGLLVVGVGLGTRLLEFLEIQPKSYRFALRLGVTTDTFDGEGRVLEERSAADITAARVEATLPEFRGEIEQLPPAYSAVKIRGKRACDRVRAGETVVLQPRRVRVHRLELIEFSPGTATLEMECSKGTYVRTIAHDIGQLLGCGAVAEKIRRLSIGPFRVEDAVAPETVIGSDHLLPLERAVHHMPALQLRPSWVPALLNGNPVPAAGYVPMPGAAAAANLNPAGSPDYGIYSPAGKLLAVGTVTPFGQLCPRKVLPTA